MRRPQGRLSSGDVMKLLSRLVAVAAILVLATAIGLALYAGMPLPYLFLDASPIAKMVMMLVMLTLVVGGVMAIALLLNRKARPSSALPVLGLCAALLGALGALYGFSNIAMALSRVGPVSLPVLAPSLSQTVFQLALGLVACAISLLANEALKARAPAEA
jgi:hypothetical protein